MNDRTVTLTFKRSELLYDVRNYAYVEADLMDENVESAKRQTFDIAEEGNVNRVNRVLSKEFSHCVELLYPYSKAAVDEQETRTDAIETPGEYSMQLSVPSTFSKTTVDILIRYIHEYLICGVLADWLSITKPEAAANWKIKQQEAEDSILSAKSIRIRRIRRGMSPF